MKAVVVMYKVDSAFAETNAANILRVMEELRALADDGIRYEVFRQEDGVSFVHFGRYADEAAVERATSLASFKEFQAQLKASKPVEPPRSQWLALVGESRALF